jgi:hypothetical protein
MNIIPDSTRLSSTRGLPWDFGKKGSRRAICVSVSQKRSLTSPLQFFWSNDSEVQIKINGPNPKLLKKNFPEISGGGKTNERAWLASAIRWHLLFAVSKGQQPKQRVQSYDTPLSRTPTNAPG